LGLVKKIVSLYFVRSQISSSVCHSSAWAVAEWVVVAGPSMMGGQGLRVFSIGPVGSVTS
jgi:hypothetical protein